MDVLHVVAGLILNNKNKMLMALRHEDVIRPSMWENPGGKREAKERPRVALARELKEELGIEAFIGPSISAKMLNLEVTCCMELFVVYGFEGVPRPLASQELRYVDPSYAIKFMPCLPGTYLWYEDILRYIQRRGGESNP